MANKLSNFKVAKHLTHYNVGEEVKIIQADILNLTFHFSRSAGEAPIPILDDINGYLLLFC